MQKCIFNIETKDKKIRNNNANMLKRKEKMSLFSFNRRSYVI